MRTKEEINLLPPLARAERMSRVYFTHLRFIMVRLLSVMVGLLIMLAVMEAALLWLSRTARTTVSSGAHSDDAGVEQRVEQTNEWLRILAARVRSTSFSSPRLSDVMRSLPAGLKLIAVSLDEKSKTITVKGESTSPLALITFEQTLKQLSWAQSVEAPLKNFATGGDGSFSFTIHPKIEQTAP